MKFDRYNDGSNRPPRLRFHYSLWALEKLPINAAVEWTLDEKFRRIKEAGFEAVEGKLFPENEAEIAETAKRHGLGLVLASVPEDLDEISGTVEQAERLSADFIWMLPGHAFMPLETVVTLVSEGRKLIHDAGYSVFVETHRGNFTENLPQALQLIERIPDIRMTADLSHLVVISQFYGWPEERAAEHFGPILERTSHIHGRVSNGQQIQVDIGDGSTDSAQFFVGLWAEAMRHWLEGAQPGDVLPFASELGPPRYAITLPDGREFSDRWEQGLVLTKLAQQAWEQACATPL